jgi:hypothetical protein
MSNALADYSNPFMAAAAVGFSCGIACSPLVTLFLTTYMMARLNNIKRSFRAFGCFWVGKTAASSFLAFLSAVLGQAVIGQSGRLAGIDLHLVVDGCLILTGIYLLAEMFWGKCQTTACRYCGASCRSTAEPPVPATGKWPLVTMGIAYGVTPCMPRLLFLLIVATLTPVQAVGLALVFSITNSVASLLVLTFLVGWVSPKMQREIPQLMRVFQITVFGSFIILGTISLVGHL